MAENPIVRIPEFQPWALAVCCVGTWRCSLTGGRVRCDAVMAEMYGLTEEEGEAGISFGRLRDIVHPEDRPIFDRKNAQVREAGGFIVAEYRIRPRPGLERWVLIRGRYEARGDDIPDVTGHGIAIDITATKADEARPHGQVYAAAVGLGDGPAGPLHRVADAAITLRREIAGLDAPVPGLELLSDLTLQTIAEQLKRQIAPDAELH